jgi:hypothetical protein
MPFHSLIYCMLYWRTRRLRDYWAVPWTLSCWRTWCKRSGYTRRLQPRRCQHNNARHIAKQDHINIYRSFLRFKYSRWDCALRSPSSIQRINFESLSLALFVWRIGWRCVHSHHRCYVTPHRRKQVGKWTQGFQALLKDIRCKYLSLPSRSPTSTTRQRQ